MAEISSEALAEVEVALDRYFQVFEQAVKEQKYERATLGDYGRGARFFVEWLRGTYDPRDGKKDKGR